MRRRRRRVIPPRDNPWEIMPRPTSFSVGRAHGNTLSAVGCNDITTLSTDGRVSI